MIRHMQCEIATLSMPEIYECCANGSLIALTAPNEPMLCRNRGVIGKAWGLCLLHYALSCRPPATRFEPWIMRHMEQ